MIHIIPRAYRDPETGEIKTELFAFEADNQEEYETRLEAALRMPLPGEPIETGGEDSQ